MTKITDEMVKAACKAHAPQFDQMDPEIQKYAREQMRSALTAALAAAVQEGEAKPKRWLLEEHLPAGTICWNTFEHEIHCRAAGKESKHRVTVTPLYAHPAPADAGVVESQETINHWITSTFGEAGTNFSVAARANEEMSELLMALAVDDNHPKAVEEAADIVIILYRLADRFGEDLAAAIDRKMKINRGRKWNVANGHGYHVKDEDALRTKGGE